MTGSTETPIFELVPEIVVEESATDAPVTDSPVTAEQPQMPTPAGVLFDTIAYPHTDDIPAFIERMQVRDAVFILVSAAAYGHKKGAYNLLESEVVSKAIRVISTPPPKTIPLEPPVPEPAK